ncbi:ATP-grasp domain-containing protein [Alphaproteobacteria bacterium]|nr:ATP-grasp domain-containing protein [Alphaproteobacteria bacterium]
MNRVRVGFTSTGGDLVASALIFLKNQCPNLSIHAINSGFDSVSANIAESFDVVPFGSDEEYVDQVKKVVKLRRLDFLIPWSDEEAISLSQYLNDLEEIGCKVLVSPWPVLEQIIDKGHVYEKMKKADLRVPEYSIVTSYSEIELALKKFGFPDRAVVVKPTVGRGGRGVNIYRGNLSLEDWIGSGRREQIYYLPKRADFPEKFQCSYIVMPVLNAPVFDADVFRFRGDVQCCYVRERVNPAGVPYRGVKLRCDQDLEQYAKSIADLFKLGSLHDIDMMTDDQGRPVLLEINPRPSGSIASLQSFGIPIFSNVMKIMNGGSVEWECPSHETLALAYLESCVMP